MPEPTAPLDGIRIASPCSQSWDAMAGDARVRFCGACRLHVYDLSAMTRPEAEALVRGREGRLCVRFHRRPDGTVLTKDCPVGLRALRRRISLLAGALAAALLGILTAGCARSGGGAAAAPPPAANTPPEVMGKIACPEPLQGDVAPPPVLQGEMAFPEPR